MPSRPASPAEISIYPRGATVRLFSDQVVVAPLWNRIGPARSWKPPAAAGVAGIVTGANVKPSAQSLYCSFTVPVQRPSLNSQLPE